MSRRKFLPLVTSCWLLAAGFTIYSYTQVDLNLTLSSNPIYQSFQHQLTNIGYFNRSLSTIIFSILLTLLIVFYFYLLFRANPALTTPRRLDVDRGSREYSAGAVSLKQIWFLIISTAIILTLSYPAFAHDIFNYMFDARTIAKYGQNPYFTAPLDFPADDWIRFMRWTHTGSVYPPGWLIATLPFYLLGFGKFTLTLLSFKFLGLVSFLASSWLMLKIAGKKAWILWSFNPMVLIESLSSVHNEITMAAFTLLGFYLSFRASEARREIQHGDKNNPRFARDDEKKKISGFIPYLALIYAGLIKYTSFLLLPFLNHPARAAAAAWVGAGAFFFAREINPWYILLPVAISLMSKNKYLTFLSLISSFLIMYRYYPCVAIFSC